ncbi:DNA repair protein RecO (recombination protein O) [Haloferula luteola]|uniref:DNA repair protein RecO n=1 Tax=Haloferula luteola TaxID=595692 RepID=A0A840UZG7_9BACT|nr:DNA repair protein RecO [Haloferula luteola]MBB5350383.1 DNA repair protein RecO (recombination protein O) [Haloferula luteola]
MEPTEGIITRLTPLTETSLIVHWFTEDAGLIKTVAKGARRPKSPFAGRLDLFFTCSLLWSPSRRSDLHTLREAIPSTTRSTIRQNYTATLLAAYFCRLLEHAVEGDHPEPELHDLLRRALDHVDTSGASLRALTHFEKELARILGLASPRIRAETVLREALGNLPPQRESLLATFAPDRSFPFPEHPSDRNKL